MLREMQWQQRNLPNQGEILLVSLLVCAALKPGEPPIMGGKRRKYMNELLHKLIDAWLFSGDVRIGTGGAPPRAPGWHGGPMQCFLHV
jgi:hypothetical protein